MNILSGGQTDFFGLDLGTTAIRVVQLKRSGNQKALEKYGQQAISGPITLSDSKEDHAKIAQVVKTLIAQAGINTRNVAVNLPSNKVFTTVIDMDRLTNEELAKTINYQADSLIPTPLNKSKIDWAVLGDSPGDPKKVEVLLSSVSNDFIQARLELLESAGLNVIAMEPDTLALVRSIVDSNAQAPQLALDIGSVSTDLVVVMHGSPRLTRSIPIGSRTLMTAAAQGLNIDVTQAQQFIYKFGISKDKLEGQLYKAIMPTVDGLMSEIDKSIRFFVGRYPTTKVEKIILTGGASSLPELPLYIANRFAMNVEIGNSWRNVSYPAERQNELMQVSNHFAVAVGLAERARE